MSKNDKLRYGPPGETAVHLCVDCKGCLRKAPNGRCLGLSESAEHTVDHFHPSGTNDLYALHPGSEVRSRRRMWRHYYERWDSMTIDQLGADTIDLVPDGLKLAVRRDSPPFGFCFVGPQEL